MWDVLNLFCTKTYKYTTYVYVYIFANRITYTYIKHFIILIKNKLKMHNGIILLIFLKQKSFSF